MRDFCCGHPRRFDDDASPQEIAEAKLRDAVAKGPQPPTEFRIFSYGPNRGTHIGEAPKDDWFDEAHADQVIAEWKRRGIALVIDYEHASIKGEPEGAPAAGWFELEKRADGLWAVNVQWNFRAKVLLQRREYRYFSQGYTTRKEKDGKDWITSLFHLALVNVPATDNQQPLMRSAVQGNLMNLYDEILKALGITPDETQAAALKAVLTQYQETMGAQTAAATETAAAAPADEATISIASAARRITGQTGAAEVEGILLAHQDGYEKARSLVKTRSSVNTKDLDDVISKASKEGKLQPGQQAKLRSGCLNPDGSVNQQALNILKIRLSATIPTGVGASVAASSVETQTETQTPANNEPPIPGDPKNVTVRLSSADKDMAKLFGHSEKEATTARSQEIVQGGFRRTLSPISTK